MRHPAKPTRHRRGPDPAETLAAIIGLILITLVMLTSPEAPTMHGAEIARYFDAR